MSSLFDTEIVKWAGIIVAVPVAYVWKRALGAVQKDELRTVIEAINKRHDEQTEQNREQFGGIFNRLNTVAEATARIEGYMQNERERQR